MIPQNPIFIIWDCVKQDIVLYYSNSKGSKVKALFTNYQLAKDAVRAISNAERRTEQEFDIYNVKELEKVTNK